MLASTFIYCIFLTESAQLPQIPPASPADLRVRAG
jgi:hypothetical protein